MWKHMLGVISGMSIISLGIIGFVALVFFAEWAAGDDIPRSVSRCIITERGSMVCGELVQN